MTTAPQTKPIECTERSKHAGHAEHAKQVGHIERPDRIASIDFLKGLAIIFVIAAHAFSGEALKMVGATLYVGQSIPIFLLVAGFTSQLSFARHGHSLRSYYYKLPCQIIYLWSWYFPTILIFMAFHHVPLSWVAFYQHLVFGPTGAGGYFVPLIVQHLLFFPLLMFLKHKLNNSLLFVLLTLGLNIGLEYLCVLWEVDSTTYRTLYVRYITVAALGAVFVDWMRAPKILTMPLTAISTAYILAIIYTEFSVPFIPELWTNHHYPAAFYTASLCALLTWLYNKISQQQPSNPAKAVATGAKVEHVGATSLQACAKKMLQSSAIAVNNFGKSSYMIYLFQMLYFTVFWNFSWLADHPRLRILLAFPICILAGLLITRLTKLYGQYKCSLKTK